MDLTTLLAALERLILERQSDGRFVRTSDLPNWGRVLALREVTTTDPFVVEQVFPVLEAFMDDAARAWQGANGALAISDLWTEVGASGEEIHLQASAMRVQGADVLVVGRVDALFEKQQLLLQRARELRLTHDSFLREIEQKDILVHAIVHDLAAPLHGILGALSLLSEQNLDEPSQRWIRVSLQAAMRQRQLISEILDVFSIELGAPSWDAGATMPDACAIAAGVASELAPAAERQGTRFEMRLDETPCLVAGEGTRLFRVLTNLLDNALRYSPRGSVITITVRREDRRVWMSVEDTGPGIPPEVIPRLFDKFARGPTGGDAGLGLYFCRITIERWGGEIGYEPRMQGGARFWLRLPAADAGDSHG